MQAQNTQGFAHMQDEQLSELLRDGGGIGDLLEGGAGWGGC